VPNQEPPSHTFLIRIWIEEIPEKVGRLSWRGRITHLPDEERRYVETFDEIASFMHAQADGPAWADVPRRPLPGDGKGPGESHG
jgi:hypothetical protein